MPTKVLMPKKSREYRGKTPPRSTEAELIDEGVECWVIWDESIWETKVAIRRYQGPYQTAPNAPRKVGFQALWINDRISYRRTQDLVLEIPAIDRCSNQRP